MTTEFPRPASGDPYEMWDASYVLGSLNSTERRVYESHLGVCDDCRTAVAELSGMPALLALLDRDEVAATPEPFVEPPPLRPEVLDALLQKVSWRRRRSRWAAWTVTAAAASVLALGVFVAARPAVTDPSVAPSATVGAMTMSSVAPSELEASFTVTGHGWGTSIDMTCTYVESAADSDDHDDSAGDELAMVAVGRDGSHVQLATWMSYAGVTVHASGSTALQKDQIASVQVLSADTGAVLLQRDL